MVQQDSSSGSEESASPYIASLFDVWKSHFRVFWPEWSTLALYATLVGLAIPYHEPWADEAQAWQLARTLPLSALFHTYLRYETAPGLWHLLLWIMNRVYVSYTGMHWICGLIAVAGTAVLLFRSPFPRYLKLTLPFTFYLVFQYAVVARSYVLVPLMLYLIAFYWKKSPIVLTLLLGLLANLSLHVAVISGGLAIVYVIEQAMQDTIRNPDFRRTLQFCALILLCLYGLAIWTAWPPSDLPIEAARGQNRQFLSPAIASLVGGICSPWILAAPFWGVIAFYFHSMRRLFYLIPVLFIAIFSGVVYAMFWHMGLMIPLLICLLWISWPSVSGCVLRHQKIMRYSLSYVICVQILWSICALVYDHYRAYSPDLATAEFLQPFVSKGAKIAVTYLDHPEGQDFFAEGILPYFDHNIFINQREPFWWWSKLNLTEVRFNAVLLSHPQIVIVETRPAMDQPINLNLPKIHLLVQSGYQLSNVFCGTILMRFNDRFTSCHLIFQYEGELKKLASNQAGLNVAGRISGTRNQPPDSIYPGNHGIMDDQISFPEIDTHHENGAAK